MNQLAKLMKTSITDNDFPDSICGMAAYLEKYYALFRSEPAEQEEY
jgi:hypothetical protein